MSCWTRLLLLGSEREKSAFLGIGRWVSNGDGGRVGKRAVGGDVDVGEGTGDWEFNS